ncbi:PJA2 ligase, partial [Thinocorus orbignyianus]|nr:PJA2 ligase [Thinocorus orbignyianus]
MGQEAGRSLWSRAAGGYQTITSGRYQRGRPYATYRPSLNSRYRDEYQHDDCERLEWEDAQKENTLCKCSCLSLGFCPVLLDDPVLENIGTREPICQSVSSQNFEANMSCFPLFSYGLEGNRITGNFVNPYENSEDCPEYACGGRNDLNGQNGIACVNIDSYETDSSDAEEDDAQDNFHLAGEAVCVCQGTLDDMFSELEKEIESFPDIRSQPSTLGHTVCTECCEEAGAMSLRRYCTIDSGFVCPGNRTFSSSVEDQAMLKSNLGDASCETWQIDNTAAVGIGAPITIANELNVHGERADQGNSHELVVRPKIRKPGTTIQLQRENLIHEGNKEESDSWRRNEVAEIQQGHAEHALRNSTEMHSGICLDSREDESHQKSTEIVLRKNAEAQEQKEDLDDNVVWDDFEVYKKYFSMSHNGEDSSEWSDGEWSAAASDYFIATEKDQTSSDGSWETVLGREECEPEVRSSSSSTEVENTHDCYQGGEQTVLEEGEIFHLQHWDEVESSSGEEIGAVNDFAIPSMFPLHRHNSYEDYYETEELEWRILGGFGYNIWYPQGNSDTDPQFPAFLAVGGYSQQTMEAALLPLESLGYGVEHAYPPAAEETIDCLPQIIFADNHGSQEQHCTICCSEFVKDEIITELPCHHLFHKPCVTRWLQKSGTCPVCRYVLEPTPPEAAAATVFLLAQRRVTSSA